MGLSQIGKNSAEEFFETIIYMTAYDMARTRIKEYTEHIEDPILKEATESALNVAVFSGIFMILRYEEMVLDKAFNVASAAVVALLALPKKVINKIRSANFRGRKLSIVSKILSGFSDDGVAKAQVVSTQLGNFISSRGNQYQAGSLIESSFKIRDNVVERDKNSLMLGSSMAQNYTNSMMFKLFTSSFTANDEAMIKKILGRDTASAISVDDMNRIGSFMFVRDTDGKITGLSEQMFSLINGLGYVHNKH